MALLGTPGFEMEHQMGYWIGEEPGARGCLMLYYRNGRLAKVEVGHFDGPAKKRKPEPSAGPYGSPAAGSPSGQP